MVDLNVLRPVDSAKKICVPVYFIARTNNEFIGVHHTEILYKEYKGEYK